MFYNLIVHPDANKELSALTKSQIILVYKQFKKISKSPELGQLLGNKNNYDLSGCRKMYVDKKRIRIVYQIIEDKIVVEVIAIGKRDDMEVYANASLRV
ncbi:MAG: type II toxin-antitoxin system RelE/ParE family toxin [Sulfurovum sp.]|nr:type II toxin-antitoxin system RelE/ParE family toxin [Sulfurovum sp.]